MEGAINEPEVKTGLGGPELGVRGRAGAGEVELS